MHRAEGRLEDLTLHFQQGAEADVETGFLAHLAQGGLLRVFAELQTAAEEGPAVRVLLCRREAAEQDAASSTMTA